MKRLLAMGDIHCGHEVGTLPKKWQRNEGQARQWQIYKGMLEEIGPVDILVVNGDAIEGKGVRTGGTELVVADRHEQIEIAAEVIRQVKTNTILMTYGTPYHVGTEEDFETPLAKMLGAEIRDMIEVGVRDGGKEVRFNFRHHVGASSIPHGRSTLIARERLWNLLWAERDVQQKAHILVRSHVHYFAYTGGSDWLGMVLPALQGLGGKYGSRRCSGTVDFGMVLFEIEKGEYTWRLYSEVLASQVRGPLSL